MKTFTRPRPEKANHRIGEVVRVDNSKTCFGNFPIKILNGKIMMFCIDPMDELGYMVRFRNLERKTVVLLVYDNEILPKEIVKVEFT